MKGNLEIVIAGTNAITNGTEYDGLAYKTVMNQAMF